MLVANTTADPLHVHPKNLDECHSRIDNVRGHRLVSGDIRDGQRILFAFVVRVVSRTTLLGLHNNHNKETLYYRRKGEAATTKIESLEL